MDPAEPPMPQIRDREVLARGARFDFEEVTLRTPDGREFRRQHLRHPGAVCILPLRETPGGLTAILVRNYRASVGSYLLEIPAGTLEEGESPEACAARELEEETGYRAATLRPLGRFHTSPGLSNEVIWAYVAERLVHVGQNLDEGEHLVVEEVPLERLLAMATGAEITDAKTMLTLLLAERLGMVGRSR